MRLVLVRAHRPAHHDQAREPAPVGRRLALVELDPDQIEPAGAQLVLEGGRRLAGDVLKGEQRVAHAELTPSAARIASAS